MVQKGRDACYDSSPGVYASEEIWCIEKTLYIKYLNYKYRNMSLQINSLFLSL